MGDIMKLTMLPARARLMLPDGREIEVEKIGKGRYSTAWRNHEHVYTQTHEKDMGKYLLSRLDDNPHLPAVHIMGYADRGPWHWYVMPLYQPLTAKSGRAWTDYKALHKHWENSRIAYRTEWNKRTSNEQDAHSLNAKFMELVDGDLYRDKELKEAVRLLVDECQCYGAYTIEITKKNCAVSGDGHLILLDPVFDLAEVRGKRK